MHRFGTPITRYRSCNTEADSYHFGEQFLRKEIRYNMYVPRTILLFGFTEDIISEIWWFGGYVFMYLK
jgi:hypothetical protein